MERGAGTRSEAGGTTATTEGSGKTNFIHLLLLKTQNNDLGGLTPSFHVYQESIVTTQSKEPKTPFPK
jgi:hypothetical protein